MRPSCAGSRLVDRPDSSGCLDMAVDCTGAADCTEVEGCTGCTETQVNSIVHKPDDAPTETERDWPRHYCCEKRLVEIDLEQGSTPRLLRWPGRVMVNHEPAAFPFDENIGGRKQGVRDLAVGKPGLLSFDPNEHGTISILPDCRIGHCDRNLREAIE